MKDFITIEKSRFIKNGRPYRFIGANFWYAMNLGSKGLHGNRTRLKNELTMMKSLGINNLRIMAGSEGPDSEPWRSSPALLKKPGSYDKALLEGLDFVLAEMAELKMEAVVCLGNFWNWSGGFGQYRAWFDKSSIPYPPPAEGGDWDTYQQYASQFYTIPKAVQWYLDHVTAIVTRTNSINNRKYSEDPTIMSWQLANEPRGLKHPKEFNDWIVKSSRLIKSLDRNHLVSTGCEGETPYKEYAGMDFMKNHSYESIDYTTAHLWVQNWDWFNPDKPETFEPAIAKAMEYIDDHVEKAFALRKPLILEEFGMARDKNSYDPTAPCTFKEKYYEIIFKKVYESSNQQNSTLCGVNFWAWGGEGRPDLKSDLVWRPGNDFLGDPAHEYQGWYSVYDTDKGVHDVIKKWNTKLAE